MKIQSILSFICVGAICVSSCTKLKETTGGSLTGSQVAHDSSSVTILLQGAYASLEYTFTSYLQIFALSGFSTDEAIVPTRGNNWDDNGIWRVIHEQKWDADNKVIHDCFNSLGGIVSATTDILQYNGTLRQTAQARFLRAWAMYWLLDLFNQVPYREPGENVVQPSKVRKGIDALNYIISEVNAARLNLPDGPPSVANKNAAKVLLMKCYLNKGIYIDRVNPTFSVSDMNAVIALADEMINSNIYTFSANYFDNFSPLNRIIGKENIFTQASNADGNYQTAMAWLVTLHYKQYGYNGFTTLPNFYYKFEATDKRREAVYDYPNAPPNPGRRVNVGFLIGQQYDLFVDTPLISGNGNHLPVIFTPDVQNILPGPNLEFPGIRPVKYAPDYVNFFPGIGPAANEFVYFRFPDVLLMKAEALLRGGSPTTAGVYGSTALSIVNSIRTDPSRNASALTSIDLDTLLDERGRELWWEGWRRQDMIRFKKFLLPFQEKNYQSDQKYVMFPIPNEQIAVNPNLVQNPGY